MYGGDQHFGRSEALRQRILNNQDWIFQKKGNSELSLN